MKNLIVSIYLVFFTLNIVSAQTNNPSESVLITSEKDKTQNTKNEKGELLVNVSPQDVLKMKAAGFVSYRDFGARGDGKTDDMDAIAAAHAFANQQNLPVKADEGANYYNGEKDRTAVIKTDTDFGTANFIIDDAKVKNRNVPVFLVASGLSSFKPEKKPGKNKCEFACHLHYYSHRFCSEALYTLWAKPKQRNFANGHFYG
jgi:hypothetical protein